jgi:Right handed beta helix region
VTLGRAAPFLAAALLASVVASGCGGGSSKPGAAPPVTGADVEPAGTCTSVASSVGEVQSKLTAASPGQTVCLADGRYPKLTLSARKRAEVTVRAQNPGRATIAGASLAGSHVTLARFAILGEAVTVQPGSDHITVADNRISRGYFGVVAGPTTTTPVSDVTIRGNKFQGPFGEDAIRANRYHDGPDADPYGLLVQGNEFTNIRENGNHSDCLQTVWTGDGLYFVRNYLHDNKCQGLFVKDQTAEPQYGKVGPVVNVVAEDNLFLRNNAPCARPQPPNCGEVIYFQLFGPITSFVMRRNTIWSPESEGAATLRDAGWKGVTIEDNVIYRPWADTAAPFAAGYKASGNLGCSIDRSTATEGTWPATGFSKVCAPAFRNPAAGDYRLPEAGVTWAVARQHYGP